MGKEPEIEITISLKMDMRTAKLFLQSSIERVINTSMNIVESVADGHEYQDINYEDWEEWKPVVVSMWTAVHDAIFRKLNNISNADQIFSLRKGGNW